MTGLHLPEETPVTDDLRQRIADALHDNLWQEYTGEDGLTNVEPSTPAELAEAVMAVVTAELGSAYTEFSKVLEIEAENCAREVERLRAAVQQALGERDHHSDRADTAESAVERAHHLAERWDAEGAWTVWGTDGTDSAAAELLAALAGPATTEEPDTPRRPGGAVYETQLHPTTTEEQPACTHCTDDGHMYDGDCTEDPALDDVITYHGTGRGMWAWSCGGGGQCAGWHGLDHASAAAARRSYDRHVRREHTTKEQQ